MTAHRHGAEGRGLRDERVGAAFDRRRVGQLALLDGQPFPQRGRRAVRMPAVADEALVQMDMAVHEARQHQVAAQVDHLHAGRRRCVPDREDAAVADGQGLGIAVGPDGIDEYAVCHGSPSSCGWPRGADAAAWPSKPDTLSKRGNGGQLSVAMPANGNRNTRQRAGRRLDSRRVWPYTPCLL
ncbi:hypothetical protein D9M68_767770 [compost metagenome]